MLKFFRLPFATTGDKTAVPDAVDSNGNVSYSQGYGFDYQRQKTDPAAKNIERDKMNQVLFDITTAIAELQSKGGADFITSALNGGTAYSYSQNAIVNYGGAWYISLVAANTTLPTDATKWALLPTPTLLQQAAFMSANAGGTVDAITATFTPAIAELPAAPGTLSVFVRATGANATTTPTFKAGALAAKTIIKGNNLPLSPGDIAGAGMWLELRYDAALDKWALQNPATGVTPGLTQAQADARYTGIGYMLVKDEKASGTSGGSAVSGTQTRTLNTVSANTITGASLASNQITLPAGTYRVKAKAPAFVNATKLFFYNVTDAANAILGYNYSGIAATPPAGDSAQSDPTIEGRITLASAKVFEVRQYCSEALAIFGLGSAVSQGVEVYTTVEIVKES